MFYFLYNAARVPVSFIYVFVLFCCLFSIYASLKISQYCFKQSDCVACVNSPVINDPLNAKSRSAISFLEYCRVNK